MAAFLENAPVGIVLSRERRITGYNTKFREMFGFAGDQGVGLPGRTIYRSDEEYAALGALATPLLSAGQPVKTEMYLRRQDGADIWVSLIGYLQNPQDPSAGTIWIIEDHTERRNAAEALKQTRDELTAIFDNASVGIIFTGSGRTIRHCNRRAAEIFGFAGPQALIGQPAIAIYPDAQSYERIGREAGPLLAAGHSFRAEWLFRKADGSPVWCRLYGRAVDPASQAELQTVWILEDITEAKRTQEELQQSLRQMEAMMRNAPVGIGFSRSRNIVHYNRRFGEMFGY